MFAHKSLLYLNIQMGSICPCPKRRKAKEYPYDVHEETFQIQDNSGNLGDSSPKNNTVDHDTNVLTEDLRVSNDRVAERDDVPIKSGDSGSFQAEDLVRKQESTEQLALTNFPLEKVEDEQPIVKEQPEKKVEEIPKFQANILKPKITKKKYNPDDYRFKDETGSFKVKKIDSIKQQQYNIDNCKDSFYFIFDITANVYIDDCENCFIFMAPCQSTIFVRNCKKLTIVAITGQFRTYQCHLCTFSLYCKSQPVIQSSSELTFTSFSSPIYEQMPQQMIKKKFLPWNNHWSEIHNFTKKEGEKHYQLKQTIDFSYIDWRKGFDQAELPISQIENPVPLIKGDLPYEPKKVILIKLHKEVETDLALKAIKDAVILKANYGVLQGEGKDLKTVILLDCLDFMPEKYEEIGTVYENPQEVEEKVEKWFPSFGDSRQK